MKPFTLVSDNEKKKEIQNTSRFIHLRAYPQFEVRNSELCNFITEVTKALSASAGGQYYEKKTEFGARR